MKDFSHGVVVYNDSQLRKSGGFVRKDASYVETKFL